MNRSSLCILSLLLCAAVPAVFAQDVDVNYNVTLISDRGSEFPSKIVEQRGYGKISLVKYANGSWQLLVDRTPYIIQGIEYSPDPIGRTPQEANEWMNDDYNNNTLCDGPYEAWVDANGDNFQDADEPNVGDFQLLEDMGCNTIRVYHPSNIDKKVLRDLYKKHGIRVIMGNYLGAYTVGSGADWSTGTDYTDQQQREKMKEDVRKMVDEFKNEPYILMWMLGNENDAPGSEANSTKNNTNAAQEPQAYASFVGEVTDMIKRMDPNHPVGVCNATYKILPFYKQYAGNLDIIGMNSYAGAFGFGTLWKRVKEDFDRPVLITEYGCDAYNQKKHEVDEDYQAEYHRKAWQDIMAHSYEGDKSGNAIGGVVYCWLDKWWLCGNPKEHDIEAGAWKGPKADGMFHDEWLGVCGQGDGSRSPFMRQPRKVYELYREELWK